MTQLTLVIGNKNYSSWSLRPWFLLKKLDIEFVEERVPLDTPDTKPSLARYDSGGKVPVLVHGDLTVWDSLAIAEYVSDALATKSAWPEDRRARALARAMSAEMHSSFPHLRAELPMNCRKQFSHIHPSALANLEIARITEMWTRYREIYGDQGEWLFGEFSIADAMYAPVVLRLAGYQVPVDPATQRYMSTVLNDEAIKSWIADARLETEIVEQDER